VRVFLFPMLACSPLSDDGGPSRGPAPTTAPDPSPTGDTAPPATVSTGDTHAPEPLPPAFADLPRDAWTYVPVEGMRCGNGSATGIGVQPGSDPASLVVILQDGGACWDFGTCILVPTASHIDTPWRDAQLQAEAAVWNGSPFFDRSAGHAWSDASWAIIPYCTGDLHAGSRVQSYNALDPNDKTHHVGDTNLQLALEALREGAPDAQRVWAIGRSAGGYGLQLQADRFVAAFPDAELALLADSSPMVQPWGGRWGLWRTAWQLRLPKGCDECQGSIRATLDARLAQLGDDVPVGLITSRSDAVLTLYMGYQSSIDPAIEQLVEQRYLPDDQLGAFVMDGIDHLFLERPGTTTATGVRLSDWVAAWRDRDPAWTDAL